MAGTAAREEREDASRAKYSLTAPDYEGADLVQFNYARSGLASEYENLCERYVFYRASYNI